jgi:hypothetical protein
MKKPITAATAIKKLRSNQLNASVENARGFSYSADSSDPRATQISKGDKSIAIERIRINLNKQQLSNKEIFDLAIELSLQNEILRLDNAELSSSMKLLMKANILMRQAEAQAAKVGGKGKSQNYEKNKRIAHEEYLRMSKAKKVSAAMLLKHLEVNFPPELIEDIQPWAEGTIRGWHRSFKK